MVEFELDDSPMNLQRHVLIHHNAEIKDSNDYENENTGNKISLLMQRWMNRMILIHLSRIRTKQHLISNRKTYIRWLQSWLTHLKMINCHFLHQLVFPWMKNSQSLRNMLSFIYQVYGVRLLTSLMLKTHKLLA